MKTIQDIYREYQIPLNLQEHMLRVTGVAMNILDNYQTEVDRESVKTTCLLHDMGNIIKFKLEKFPEFLEPEGLEYWQEVKNDFIQKYGDDEHLATKLICEELAMSDKVLYLIDHIGLEFLDEVLDSNNLELQICDYSDRRAGPHGIMSASDRYNDLFNRLKEKGEVEKYGITREGTLQKIHELEENVFANCSIKPSDINDESVAPAIESLRTYSIDL